MGDRLSELVLSKAEVDAIPLGGSCAVIREQSLLLHKSADGALQAAPNACKHMGGSFEIEDAAKAVARCVLHGWKLDTSSMSYVASVAKMHGGADVPAKVGERQPVYAVAKLADGGVKLTPPADGGCVAC